jgi:two-component system LytT family response regulator
VKYSCIIVEDEPLALERLRDYVFKDTVLDLQASFDNAKNAQSFLNTNEVDLLFLDIEMDELSGIEFLERSEIKSQVIITTAYDEYALKGFDLEVTDYLLKPFTFERFQKAVKKAIRNLEKNNSSERDFIFIKTEYRLEKIFLKDILYIEGMRDYRRIFTIDKRVMTLQTFGELEMMIPKDIVCRVHKSFMVALHKIDNIERNRIKIGEKMIPVSESYKKEFLKLIGR